MERHLLSFGYISDTCSSQLISCGDPESYDAKREITYYLPESDYLNLYDHDTEKVVSQYDNFFSTPSKVADFLASEIKKHFSFNVSPNDLCQSWSLFQEEIFISEIYDSKMELVDSEFGEFKNLNQNHNGKLIFRYILEDDDGEVSQDSVILISK